MKIQKFISKMLPILLAVTLLFVGCSSTNNNGTASRDTVESESGKALLDKLEKAKKQFASGKTITVMPEKSDEPDYLPLPEDETTFIGYGINILSGTTFADGLLAPLLNDNVYSSTDAKSNSYIDSVTLNSVDGTSSVGDTLSEVYTNLQIKADVRTGASVPFFSGGVEAQYGNEKTVKSQAKFYNSIFSIATKKQTLKAPYILPQKLRGLIDEDVLDIIDSEDVSPEELFEACGTHIILSDSIGGSVNVSGLYNSDQEAKKQDISAALDFKSNFAEAKVSTKLTDEQKRVASQTKITVTSRGGDVGAFTGLEFDSIGPAIKAWGSTVAGEPTISNIYKSLPIWKLAKDKARQEQIEAYFYSYADSLNKNLLSYFSKSSVPDVPKVPAIQDGEKYTIIEMYSLKAIDVLQQSKDEDAVVHLWDEINNLASQQWIAVASKASPGYFSFKNANSGKVLDVPNGNDSASLQQHDSNGSDAQLFKFKENGDGTITLISKLSSGKVVTGSGTVHGNGTKLILTTDSSNAYQKWIIKKSS